MVNLLLLIGAVQVAFICFVVLWVTKIDEYLRTRDDLIDTQERGDA